MRFARMQPSSVVTGSTKPYVAFLTMWLRATASTSISVSSDSVAGTPYYSASFAVIDSLSNEQRRLSLTFWSTMMTLLSAVSFSRVSISSVRA